MGLNMSEHLIYLQDQNCFIAQSEVTILTLYIPLYSYWKKELSKICFIFICGTLQKKKIKPFFEACFVSFDHKIYHRSHLCVCACACACVFFLVIPSLKIINEKKNSKFHNPTLPLIHTLNNIHAHGITITTIQSFLQCIWLNPFATVNMFRCSAILLLMAAVTCLKISAPLVLKMYLHFISRCYKLL